MNARPILFSGPMICAMLDGKKSQTRRIVKPQPSDDWLPEVGFYHPTLIDSGGDAYPGLEVFGAADDFIGRPCPYGAPGSLLWVRETWGRDDEDGKVFYRADVGRNDDTDSFARCVEEGGPDCYRWRPSIHMPRAFSRLTLRITDVRVQRLQEISNEDAVAEGIGTPTDMRYAAQDGFRPLWERINGEGSWDANPFVWCVSFSVIRENVDAVLAREKAA